MATIRSNHLIILFLLLSIAGCKKDETPQNAAEPHPVEVMTTLRMALVDTSDNVKNNVTVTFRDLDGSGGTPATADTLTLRPGVTYFATVTLSNERSSPATAVTPEIQREAKAHRVWYTVSGGIASKMSIAYFDSDGANPLGLAVYISVSTTNVSTGSLRVVLRHYDPESLKLSDLNGILGAVDIDATFPIVIR